MSNVIIQGVVDQAQSSKYQLFFVSVGVGSTAYVLSVFFPPLATNLVSLLTFITGIYAIFCGGNVAATWVGGGGVTSTSAKRAAQKPHVPPQPPEP